MERGVNQKRNGIIDIYRALFAIVIMTGHSVNVGMEVPFPFAGVGIFVEFFYLLTGYYTCVKFSKVDTLPFTSWMQESIRYTYRKVKVFFPYLLVSVALRYLYDGVIIWQSGGGIKEILKALFYAPFELFLTNYIFVGIPQKVGALYFLAAMVVVLPVFCVLCLCRNNTIKLGIALYCMLAYYRDADWAIAGAYPQVLARAFCGMCMGIVVYYFADELRANKRFFKWKYLVMIMGNLMLLSSMALSGLSHDNRRIQLLGIFFGALAIILADDWIKVGSNSVTNYLAKFSMVLYIMHWTIGIIVNGMMRGFEIPQKMAMYYVVTVVSCVALIWIIERMKSVLQRHRGC